MPELMRECDSLYLCPYSNDRRSRVWNAKTVADRAKIRYTFLMPWHSEHHGNVRGMYV